MSIGSIFQNDLAQFSDPATEVMLTEAKNTSRLQFVRNGLKVDFLINHSDGAITARHQSGKRYSSVRSLLASAEFADIRGFATTQARMFRDFEVEKQIPPEGELNGKRLALQTFLRLAAPSQTSAENPALRVMLLDGPAGVGKTSLIQRLLVQRARAKQDTGSAPPILHVASRGKRLSSLDDVLAQSLQLMRTKFTFDQVPSLIRHNLIQLAIDGFDELVDPEGYRDAWFALRDFFDMTSFGGPIILAGRDTFFDEQDFSAQMRDSKQLFELSHARLGEVSTAAAKSWLSDRGWKKVDLDDPYTELVLRSGSYTLRPYFLQELANAKSWRSIESLDLTPRAYLVDRFLDRECGLLGEKITADSASLKELLEGVFEEVAIEMADTETDAVDLSFLQLVTEYAFGDMLSSKDVAKLRHKSGSFALLINDARDGFRRFPHSEIAHHFLSRALLGRIAKGTPSRFLRRGVVGSDFLAVFAEQFVSISDAAASTFLEALERVRALENSYDRLQENIAAMVLTCLCRSIGELARVYSDMQASNVSVFGELAHSKLERVKVQRWDAEEASFVNVEFIDCEIVNFFADATTRFGASFPMIHRLHLKSRTGVVSDVFDPSEIKAWIGKQSFKPVSKTDNNDAAVALLDKVCRIMLRQHVIKDHEDDEFGKVLRHPYWREVEAILIERGFIERIHGKQISGAQAPFLRMREPYSLLANKAGSKYLQIWRRVAAIKK